MDGNCCINQVSPGDESLLEMDVPFDTFPHLMSPDPLPTTLPSTPTHFRMSRHRKNNNVSSLVICGEPATVSPVVVSDKNAYGQYMISPRQYRVSPTNRLSHLYAYGESPFSSYKPSRYAIGILGEEPPSHSGYKSIRVRKVFANARSVLPLRRCISQGKPIHRRDSYASLPKIAEIGISKEDLLHIGAPSELNHPENLVHPCVL